MTRYKSTAKLHQLLNLLFSPFMYTYHTHMHAHIHAHKQTHTYTHIHTHIHTYTHIHTTHIHETAVAFDTAVQYSKTLWTESVLFSLSNSRFLCKVFSRVHTWKREIDEKYIDREIAIVLQKLVKVATILFFSIWVCRDSIRYPACQPSMANWIRNAHCVSWNQSEPRSAIFSSKKTCASLKESFIFRWNISAKFPLKCLNWK